METEGKTEPTFSPSILKRKEYVRQRIAKIRAIKRLLMECYRCSSPIWKSQLCKVHYVEHLIYNKIRYLKTRNKISTNSIIDLLRDYSVPMIKLKVAISASCEKCSENMHAILAHDKKKLERFIGKHLLCRNIHYSVTVIKGEHGAVATIRK